MTRKKFDDLEDYTKLAVSCMGLGGLAMMFISATWLLSQVLGGMAVALMVFLLGLYFLLNMRSYDVSG